MTQPTHIYLVTFIGNSWYVNCTKDEIIQLVHKYSTNDDIRNDLRYALIDLTTLRTIDEIFLEPFGL